MQAVIDQALYRGRSIAESEVIHAVWDEVGGELVEEFVVPTIPGDRSRAREIDGVFLTGNDRRWHRARTPLALRGRDIIVCQAKAGELDLGVLGQTLFASELIERQHAPRGLRSIAAAVTRSPLIERLLDSYRPLGRTLEHRTYPDLPLGKSSGAKTPAALRQLLVSTLHSDLGGLLIASGTRRGIGDFRNVCIGGHSLRQTQPDAIILPSRRQDEINAAAPVEIRADEPLALVYTGTDLYMTTMGRAVFGGEIARRLLGGGDVTSYLRYRTDNSVLRELIEQLPHVVLPRRR